MKKIILLIVLAFLSSSIQSQKQPKPLHVEVVGKGKSILLIPGFTVPGDIWKPLVKELQKNYECHLFTLAGFGEKAPIAFPWLPKVNRAFENYIKDNNLKEVTIIGHSLGGTIATLLASQSELNVSQLIIVDALPATGAMMMPNYNPDNFSYDNPYNNQQLDMDDAQFSKIAMTMAKGMSTNEAAQKRIKNWILEADRKTYVYGYTDYLKLDVRDHLKAINIPVTIIAATKPYGKVMATETYKTQYANLKNYDLIFADDASHFVMLDRPDWFNTQIIKMLSSK